MKLRTQTLSDGKWYCLKDVAEMLEINTRHLVRKFALRHQVKTIPQPDAMGRISKFVFIDEEVYFDLIRVYG